MQKITLIRAKLTGKQVGEDEYGNRYFELNKTDYWGKKKRICIFKGIPEASKVPPEWHGWLHYKHDISAVSGLSKKYPWQSPHLPLLTGTIYKFLPFNHPDSKSPIFKKESKVEYYDSWKP